MGVKKCCLASCTNINRDKQGRSKSYHRFPISNDRVRNQWVDFCYGDPLTVKNNTRNENRELFICSDHFSPQCYNTYTKRKVLNSNSVPSIYTTTTNNGGNLDTPRRQSTVTASTFTMRLRSASPRKQMGPTVATSTPKSHPIQDVRTPMTTPRSRRTRRVREEGIKDKDNDDVISYSPCVRQKRRPKINSPSTPKRFCDYEVSEINSSNIDDIGHFNIPDRELLDSSSTFSRIDLNKSNLDVTNVNVKKNTFQDHSYAISNPGETPRRMNKKLKFLKEKVATKNKQVILLQNSVGKLKRNVKDMKDVISELKEKELLSENAQKLIEKIFSGAPLDLFQRSARNIDSGVISRSEYPPDLRAFALTLHFHSTAAYNYVRETFNFTLPDVSTLRSWYSEIDAGVGFCNEAFQNLKIKSEEGAKQNLPRPVVAMIIDEMHLKKDVSYNGKSFSGLIDMGTGLDPDGLDRPLASEALVFMIVSLESNWKMPIAHFFTNGLSGAEKANLIQESLIRLDEIGYDVVSLTCDGPSVNFSMCEALGANLNLDNFRGFFQHPSCPDRNIEIMLDPCHMIKLVRNTFEAEKVIFNSKIKKLEWRFIQQLHDLQEREKLRAGNKLRKKHLQFRKQIMKVNLAVQTLSASVADAIEFCDKVMNYSEFKGSGPTVEFIRTIDRAFDHLNSRNPLGKGLKAPLRQQNEFSWRPFFQQTMDYILGLKSYDQKSKRFDLLYRSRRKTGVVGFFVCLNSTRNIYDKLCRGDSPRLKYLLTYKMSQDHLELFFGAVRSRGGWNNNPTCEGFTSAFKRLLIRNEIKGGRGNVTVQDRTKILYVKPKKSERRKKRHNRNTDIVNLDEIDLSKSKSASLRNYENSAIKIIHVSIDHENPYAWNPEPFKDLEVELSDAQFIEILHLQQTLNLFTENVVAYIGGKTVRMVEKNTKCLTCISALEHKLDLDTIKSMGPDTNEKIARLSLIIQKSRGGLKIPSDAVVDVCIATEKFIKLLLRSNDNSIFHLRDINLLISNTILMQLGPTCDKLFEDLKDHIFDNENGSNHLLILIKSICQAYVDIRMFDFGDRGKDNIRGDGTRVQRARLSIFQNL